LVVRLFVCWWVYFFAAMAVIFVGQPLTSGKS